MTALDERSISIGSVDDGDPPPALTAPPPVGERRRAVTPAARRRSSSEAEVRTLRVARFAATTIMGLIAVASFVLSFSSLWDLASRSVSWPRDLAWLWPLIVDGVVVVATIAIRALTRTAAATEMGPRGDGAPESSDEVQLKAQHRRDRTFFWWLLVAAASVSVAGNGLHSLLPPGQPLSPWLSVVIGCIPACALLATTHALQRLSRLQIRPAAAGEGLEAWSARADEVAELRADKWHAVAAGIHERGLLVNQSTDSLAAVLTLLFDARPTPSLRSIATQVGLAHHDIVSRVRDAALLVLHDSAGR